MKKKFLTFALILMVCCSAIFIMAGCDGEPTYKLSCNIGTELDPIPFALNADADMTNRNERNDIIIAGLTSAGAVFNLIENAKDEGMSVPNQLPINDVINGGSVLGFSVNAPGTFKMTVTYQGYSCYIYYTVA